MKRIIAAALTLIVIFGFCTAALADEEEAPLFRFTCVSDLHLDDIIIQGSHKNRDQFKKLLKYSYEKGYSDLFVCDGDVSSYGNTSVWEEARKAASDAGFKDMLWALGNHGYGTVFENSDADKDFMKFVGEDAVYYHKVLGGYHFLCMGAEKCDLLVGAGQDVYGSAQLRWLERELAAAAEDSDGKPIFVLSHYPMSSNGVEKALTPILKQYQNVFFLWGHKHDADWAEYTIDKYVSTAQEFVTARTGCVQYGYSNLADALLVDVYSDKVVLTVDRTDGKAMSPNSVTVMLKYAPWDVRLEDDRLSWCVSGDEDVNILACSYTAEGEAVMNRMFKPEPNIPQYIAATASDGYTKVFYVDSDFKPVREASTFSGCCISQ